MPYFSDENLRVLGVTYDDVCAYFPLEWREVREEVCTLHHCAVECGERDPVRMRPRVLGAVSGELSLAQH